MAPPREWPLKINLYSFKLYYYYYYYYYIISEYSLNSWIPAVNIPAWALALNKTLEFSAIGYPNISRDVD